MELSQITQPHHKQTTDHNQQLTFNDNKEMIDYDSKLFEENSRDNSI